MEAEEGGGTDTTEEAWARAPVEEPGPGAPGLGIKCFEAPSQSPEPGEQSGEEASSPCPALTWSCGPRGAGRGAHCLWGPARREQCGWGAGGLQLGPVLRAEGDMERRAGGEGGTSWPPDRVSC